MIALRKAPANSLTPPLSLPPNIWFATGVFGLTAGLLVLLLTDPLLDRLVWLVEN